MGVFHTHTISSEALSMLVIRLPTPLPPEAKEGPEGDVNALREAAYPEWSAFHPRG